MEREKISEREGEIVSEIEREREKEGVNMYNLKIMTESIDKT